MPVSASARLILAYTAPIVFAAGIRLLFYSLSPGAKVPSWKSILFIFCGAGFAASYRLLIGIARETPDRAAYLLGGFAESAVIILALYLDLRRKAGPPQ